MSTITVVLVDDHRIVTRSLQSYLESFPDLRVVGTAASGEELLQHVDAWQPDVIVQDLLLPGGIDGIETTRRVLAKRPSARVVALTASTDEARMMAVLRAGAAGYIRKDAEPETLLAAIRAVARGRTYVDPYLARRVAEDGVSPDDLTDREREVLRHLALGESNKVISEVLFVSEETVKTHVGHILGKLGVENRAQAVVQALKRGLVSLEELE
jgi:two-component system, NarL family, response regulator LiaR